MDFDDKTMVEFLEKATPKSLDKVDFGIIGIDKNCIIHCYNNIEEEYSGYSRDYVMGKNLFLDVAPCMNNYLVALKFEEQPELDEIIPYILSFKVKPVHVRLRLIKNRILKFSYVIIKR